LDLAIESGNDARRYRVVQPERIANRDELLPNEKISGRSKLQRFVRACDRIVSSRCIIFNLQHRNVELRNYVDDATRSIPSLRVDANVYLRRTRSSRASATVDCAAHAGERGLISQEHADPFRFDLFPLLVIVRSFNDVIVGTKVSRSIDQKS
jgi:hypothetical protein